MNRRDALFWIWLSDALGAENRDFRSLITVFDSAYDLFHADEEEIEHIAGLSERTKQKLCSKDLSRASEILSACEKLGIMILSYDMEAYPKSLREIKTPPVLLYVKGNLPNLNDHLSIAMVGTRRMSAYGLQNAYRLSYELASCGVTVISGMAAGIDGVSAAGALAAGGPTVAVLGAGVDVVYPKHHKALAEKIVENGALISEYPPGTRPDFYRFPARNRIISGLSAGTLVVEAGIGSGSLITAKNAILQGRDVFALPANVGACGAEGTNGLLRDGARLVLESADILELYRYSYAETLLSEKLPSAKAHSQPDMQYLSRLGVIELEQRKEVSAPSAPQAEKPKRRKAEMLKMKEEAPAASALPEEHVMRPARDTSMLSPIQREILDAMPEDRAIAPDVLSVLNHPVGDIIAALTMLEILELVQKLPGGLYTKN